MCLAATTKPEFDFPAGFSDEAGFFFGAGKMPFVLQKNFGPLFTFRRVCAIITSVRGISAVGSAPQWHCGGQGFDSLMLHHQQGAVAEESNLQQRFLFLFRIPKPLHRKQEMSAEIRYHKIQDRCGISADRCFYYPVKLFWLYSIGVFSRHSCFPSIPFFSLAVMRRFLSPDQENSHHDNPNHQQPLQRDQDPPGTPQVLIQYARNETYNVAQRGYDRQQRKQGQTGLQPAAYGP